MMGIDEFYDIENLGTTLMEGHQIAQCVPLANLIHGENKMAEVDTNQLSHEHGTIRLENAEHTADIRYNVAERAGDIRREIAQSTDSLNDSVREEGGRTRSQSAFETGDIIREGLKGSHAVTDTVKDARYETVSRVEGAADRLDKSISDTNFNLSSRVENAQDRNAKDIADFRGSVADRFFAIGRDITDNRAQINALGYQVRDGFAQAAAVMENAVLKNEIAGHKNTQYLNDKINDDGEKTRALIQDLKYHDLNRGLVERNAELVNARHERGHYHDRWLDGRFDQNQAQFAGQWAQLQNQVQAFASQLQETRQGMVNFGSMTGVGQTSTSNNVR